MIIKNIALTKMVVYQNISNTLSHTPSPANMSVRFVEKKKRKKWLWQRHKYKNLIAYPVSIPLIGSIIQLKSETFLIS